jgi:MFS family permease
MLIVLCRTVRAMITENSTPRTQARAFSFFAFSGNVGIFLGPLIGMYSPHLVSHKEPWSFLVTERLDIGGGLASPAEQYPSIFGDIKFFEEYPYALPTFVTGAIGGAAAVCCALFVKEVSTGD